MSYSHVNMNCTHNPWQQQSLRELLGKTDTFVTCVELVTSRGVITERNGQRVLGLARNLTENPRIHVLSITDNPGGNAMLTADTLGKDLISRGQEVVIHLSCKDWNRNGLKSRAWQLASEGFDNVLVLSGDYPTDGYHGQSSSVFDIDSVGLLKMFSEMNSGMTIQTGKKPEMLTPTKFFLGAVVNNHKRYENELMPQYFKLAKKIGNGAGFVINQIGYDSRKQDELIKYLAMRDFNVPVLANVYVLSRTAARYFNADNIPGVTVTDELLNLAETQARAADKGKSFFLELAAKQCAIAKGLGYRGVYIGGHLKYEDYDNILTITDTYSSDDWQEFSKEIGFGYPDEFYFFEGNPKTGLSSTEVNREYRNSKRPAALEQSRRTVSIIYKINRALHGAVFEDGTAGFKIGRKFFRRIEKARGWVQKAFHASEHTIKKSLFECHDCGDCSLPDLAYLCPESQCLKNQRNGPCGGTRQGKCEIGEKDCIWARAYDRLKAYGNEEEMLGGPVIFRNGALKGTSAWANAFLGRDNRGKPAKKNGEV